MKDIIVTAIKDIKNTECTLSQEEWGVDWDPHKNKWVFENIYLPCCCALGAVLMKYQPEPILGVDEPQVSTLAKFFSTTETNIHSFIRGYDNCPSDGLGPEDLNMEIYNLGRQVGVEFGLHYGPFEDVPVSE